MPASHRTCALVTALSLATATLFIQGPSPALADEPADVLSGPRIAAPQQTKKSLIQRDSEGKLVLLERQPAEAALDLLSLDDKSKAKAQEVLLARSKAMDAFLQDNLLEVAAAANAFQSGQAQEGLRQVMLLRGRSPALRGREKLTDELAAALPKKQGDELKALVKEYWEAIAKEGADQGQREQQTAMLEGTDAPESMTTEDDQPMNPIQRGLARAGGGGAAIAREALRLLGQDIKAAYERTILSQSAELEESLKRLNLKPEQESRVRAHIQDAFSQNAGKKPSDATRKAAGTRAFLKVWQELDTSQKQELMKIMREKGYVK
jgi:hypothetical protein